MSQPGKEQQQHTFRKSEVTIKLHCPTCRTSNPDFEENYSAGDLVCKGCGTVLGDRIIDTRSEWRTFANESGGVNDDPSRVGGPSNPILERDTLETTISHRDGMTGISKELNRLQNRTNYRPEEKNLMPNFRIITAYCDRLGVNRVISDRAKQLFKKADEEKLTKGGKANDVVVAACILIACRQENVPRTFKEISSLCKIPKRDIGRTYKEVEGILDDRVGVVDPEALISRFCSILNLTKEVQRVSTLVAQRAFEMGMATGKSPISIATASIYLILQLLPSQAGGRGSKDLATVAGIAENTIRANYRDIYAARRRLVPEGAIPTSVVESLPEPYPSQHSQQSSQQ